MSRRLSQRSLKLTLPFPSDSEGSATSDFSAEAKGYLARVQQRVVLINGKHPARDAVTRL